MSTLRGIARLGLLPIALFAGSAVLAQTEPAAAPTLLAETPNWTADGIDPSSRFGESSATAGDVNGDGYSDLIVGAPDFNNGRGAAFLYLGSPTGLSAGPAWFREGSAADAHFGKTVAPAGDINGNRFDESNRFDDVIVSEPGTGKAYLFHGSSLGLSLEPDASVDALSSCATYNVPISTAGDVDGDGFDDVIVVDGEAAVVYRGSATGLCQGGACTAERRIVLSSVAECVGAIVSSAGDVSGDGRGDVVVTTGLGIGVNFGLRIYSSTVGGLLDDSVTIPGIPAVFGRTTSIGTAGDVNGDGFGDLTYARVSQLDLNQLNSITVHVLLGPLLEDTSSDPISGFRAPGTAKVATLGDLNGDGFSDVIVGADFFDSFAGEQGTDEGQAWIYLGSADGLSMQPDESIAGSQLHAELGRSVAAAGDVNGDGIGDLLVGAPGFAVFGANQGRAFVYHGAQSMPGSSSWTVPPFSATVDLLTTTSGDFNGDGISDSYASRGGRLYLGSEDGLLNTNACFADADQFFPIDPTQVPPNVPMVPVGDIDGDGLIDWFGDGIATINQEFFRNIHLGVPVDFSCVDLFGPGSCDCRRVGVRSIADATLEAAGDPVAAGDVNADGRGDVLVGGVLYLGSAVDLLTPATPSWTAAGPAGSAGDVNGDGFGDLWVLDTQQVKLFFGSESGPSTTPIWIGSNPLLNPFEWNVAAAGDVNGDGFADLVVGVTGTPGRAFLYIGSAAGPSIRPDWTVSVYAPDGIAVSTAGDVNADGYSDTLVGARGRFGNSTGTVGDYRPGATHLYFGGMSGPSTVADWSTEMFPEGTTVDRTLAAGWGEVVGSAGDVNGDGVGDFMVSWASDPDPIFNQVDTGWRVFYGAPPSTVPALRVQQFGGGIDCEDPIAVGGNAGSSTEFCLRATGRPLTGGGLGLQWEVASLDDSLDGSNIQRGTFSRGTFVPAAAPDAIDVTATVDRAVDDGNLNPLREGAFYRWRMRLATGSPFLPWTRWVSLPDNNVSQTKLRTSGNLPAKDLLPVTPGQNDRVSADADPLKFVWNTGGERQFRIEWSRNPAFEFQTESAVVALDAAPAQFGDWATFTPPAALWPEILSLAQQVDFRGAPVFWRIAPLNATAAQLAGAEIRAMRVVRAGAPNILGPPNGVAFPSNLTPTLVWNANHNDGFQVRFSTHENIGSPLIVGANYDLPGISCSDDVNMDTTCTWRIPDDAGAGSGPTIWDEVKSLRGPGGGIVYWVVLARDALGATAFIEIRNMTIQPGAAASVPVESSSTRAKPGMERKKSNRNHRFVEQTSSR